MRNTTTRKQQQGSKKKVKIPNTMKMAANQISKEGCVCDGDGKGKHNGNDSKPNQQGGVCVLVVRGKDIMNMICKGWYSG
jgi:hypothetical protein